MLGADFIRRQIWTRYIRKQRSVLVTSVEMDEKRYQKRKDRALADNNRDQIAICCNALGNFYNEQGRYTDAVVEYRQEADLYAKMGKKLNRARAHRMVGEMYMLLSDFEQAKEHINLYLKFAKQLQNQVEEQRAYVTLGRAHLLHGQSSCESSESDMLSWMKQAEKAFLKSLLLIKELTGQISKLEQLDMQARCYLNIGVVKDHMELFEEAIVYIDKAVKISRAHDLFELTHLCYISMAMLYQHKKKDATTALRYCNLALEVAKRLSNKVKKICETLITKAEILIKEGDFASAKQILVKAYKKNTPDENDRVTIEKMLRVVVKICEILDNLVTTSSVDHCKRKKLYENLGDGCCQLLNYGKALEFYRQMLECAVRAGEEGKDLVPIYVSLYQTYKDNGQYELALEFLWKEFELSQDVPMESVNTLCSIADIYETQQQTFWVIQDIYQRARSILDKMDIQNGADAQLQRIIFVRLHKLQLKHNMLAAAADLEEEAKQKSIDLSEENDTEDMTTVPCSESEQNTPQLGDDVCLEELTDSDTSDVDESDKPRLQRSTRGTRALTIKRNNKGETQLHQACIAGNLELARRLLEQGHAVNVRDHAGWTPLHEASNHGFRDIAELLLDHGGVVAINDKGGTSCDGITPLYDACANGFLGVIELLLDRGADSTLRTDFGETCLDGLDKWRRSVTLTVGEQMQYVQVRAALLKPLTTLGIIKKRLQMEPLTNENTIDDGEGDATLVPNVLDDQRNSDEEEISNRRRRTLCSAERVRKDQLDSNAIKSPIAKQVTASMEYRTVMDQLKRPNRFDGRLDDITAEKDNRQKRGAFLDSEEVIDDDWLIDDVGPEKKKRRYGMLTLETNRATLPATMTTTSQHTPSNDLKENSYDSSSPVRGLDQITPDSPNAFHMLLDAANNTSSDARQKKARKLRLSRSASISSTTSSSAANISATKPRYQASLLESGFSRLCSDSPLFGEDSLDSLDRYDRIEADSTTSHLSLTSPKKSYPTAPVVLPSTVSFKVKVENELLLVPIDRKKLNDINIRWLAEEAGRRYYNLVGLRPVLRLKTVDGFAYEENDSVNVAIEQNMILASVLEWKISALPQRYEEMCLQMKADINMDVKRALEHAQASSTLRIQDLWLSAAQAEPLFKAVPHQNSLRVIDLCNNFTQDDGCLQLAKALPTLQQLKVLNLEGNYITTKGLDALLSAVSTATVLQLEELNISQNPLGDMCLRSLHNFCTSAAGTSLQRLHISHCSLENLGEYDLCFFQLTTLDISFNQLNDISFRWLLNKLNSCRLKVLNLSYTISKTTASSAALRRIATFFESGTCEKFKRISLAGLYLDDIEIKRIVQCVKNASELEAFDVTDNIRLTSSAFESIIAELTQVHYLKATNCPGIVIDEDQFQRLSLLKQLPNLISLNIKNDNEKQHVHSIWKMHWGDKGRIRSYGSGHCLLYVHDKDVVNFFKTTL